MSGELLSIAAQREAVNLDGRLKFGRLDILVNNSGHAKGDIQWTLNRKSLS
jgi:NADP-dependent 3-hydroxy acid dehydrogenase YdfG